MKSFVLALFAAVGLFVTAAPAEAHGPQQFRSRVQFNGHVQQFNGYQQLQFRQQFAVPLVRPSIVVRQQFFAPYQVQQFVAPYQVQQFAAPVYSQQFIAPQPLYRSGVRLQFRF